MDYDRLRELQEKFEENPRRYFAPLANEYRKGGQPKRAIEICRAQLAQMPGHMSGQIVYGQALYEAGEFQEAREVFQRALALDPENLIALRSLGDMSLQSGDTAEARSWYTRLLDADPKDTAVIALVAEIDASAEAITPVLEEIPGVDTDAGDQTIPFIADAEGQPIGPEAESTTAPPERAAEAPSHPAAPAPVEAVQPERAAPPPEEREAASDHVEPSPPQVVRAEMEAPEAAVPDRETPQSAPPEGLERHYPTASDQDFEKPLGAEGLQSKIPSSGKIGAENLRALRPAEPVGTEGLQGKAPEDTVPEGTEGLKGTPPPAPLAGATASKSDDEEALDDWTPPPPATAQEQKEAPREGQAFSGPAPEPFVNETMAQLYLQQGYRQLALRVYYQLAETRPNDQALKDRIAQIEAEDRAAHPEVAAADRPVQARREPPPVERPAPEPSSPRSPSIESPTPGGGPESEETPSFDRSPVDSPPTSQPERERESVESPARDEPRAEPEGIAARQPSIKEFFATLGRRRPPRVTGTTATSRNSYSSPVPEAVAPLAAATPIGAAPPIGGAAPSASLDAVFVGATVNPADSRAASRLAGAFSAGTGGPTSRTPPTPPMPTPRVNPRVPAAQESEEDVAKFRAWLDGLTGE